MTQTLADVYLDKVRRSGAGEQNVQAVKDHFEIIAANIRRVEEGRLAAEPSHVAALQAFAERAYRRPLSTKERDELVSFYRSLRQTDGLTHEEAVRETNP